MFRAISRAGGAGMTTVALGVVLSGQAPPSAPVAKTEPKTTTLHGETLVDNYDWLREKGSPDVIAYLEAENAYTAARMKHTEALQETLYKELLGRIKEIRQRGPVPARTATGTTREPSRARTIRSTAGRRARSTRRKRSSSIRTRWRPARSFTRSAGSTSAPTARSCSISRTSPRSASTRSTSRISRPARSSSRSRRSGTARRGPTTTRRSST